MGGVASWTDVLKEKAWIAGREIGTAGEVFFLASSTLPGTAAGVGAPAGWTHQSGGASPKAPSGAGDYAERTIAFRPYLAKLDFELFQRLRHTQRQGLKSLWLPIPRVES